MGEQLFDVCAWDEAPVEDVRIGDVVAFAVDNCRVKSEEVLLCLDVGMPMRSENGWPNASQSFSTRTFRQLQKWIV